MQGMKTIRTLAVAACLLIPTVSLATYENNIANAGDWLSTQQNLDGSWGSNSGIQLLYTTEIVQALYTSGQRNYAYYKGITWLENHAATNGDYLARQSSALATHGDDVSSLNQILTAQQNTTLLGHSGWGLSSNYLESPIDTAIVLSTLSSTIPSVSLHTGIDYLKSAQNTAGDMGWPVATESGSDPFVTALVIKTLDRLQSVDPTVTTAINNGISYLATTVVSSSPVYLQALSAQAALLAGNLSVAQNWLDMLVSEQGADGSWVGGAYDTALAAHALSIADGGDGSAIHTLVYIPDANLRAAINRALGRNAMDSIDRAELLRLTSLTAEGVSISDLTGLEWATNLTTLDLKNNNIVYTAPIEGLTQLTTVQLDGNPIDYPPTAVADSNYVVGGLSVDIDVLKNDSDPNGDPITLDDVTQGTHGTVVINNQKVTYTPSDVTYAGIDTFTYTVSDDKNLSSTGTVTVTVYAKDGDEDNDGTTNYDEMIAGRNIFLNEPAIMVIIQSLLN